MSVVVPVFNPGPHVDGLIASLRRQTLAAEAFDLVFVDDGSTDGTADRLHRLAAEACNFRVVRIPRSGWRGRPPNVGIEAARGQCIQFADDDDELGDEALERLYAFATENNSDVVIGQEIRTGRPYSFPYGLRLFAQSHPRIGLDDRRLLMALSPHKMFRREFLVEHGIRFPEGCRVFEDYAFVMEACLCADVISVLSGYPCYLWKQREDRTSAGEGARGRDYSDTIEVIRRRTEPGELRDRLLAHWYVARVLRLADGRWALSHPAAAEGRFQLWRKAAERHCPPEIDPQLPVLLRVRSALIRAGELQLLRALSSHGLQLRQRPLSVERADDELRLTSEAWLADPDGVEPQTDLVDGRVFWRPPVPVDGVVPPAALDLTADLWRARADLVARQRGSAEARLLPVTSVAHSGRGHGARLGVTVTACFDEEPFLAGGTTGRQAWDVFLPLNVGGWHDRQRLRSPAPEEVRRPLTPPLRRSHVLRASTTTHGNVVLRLRPLGRPAQPGSPRSAGGVRAPSAGAAGGGVRRAYRRLRRAARRLRRHLSQ